MRKSKLSSIIGASIAILLACAAGTAWYFILTGVTSNQYRAADTAVALTKGGNPDKGQDLIVAFGCAACHEIPGIPAAHGKIGPSLKDFKERQMIGGVMANSPENLLRWLQDPRAVDPQTAMPNLGLTEQQSRDVAAYLYAPK